MTYAPVQQRPVATPCRTCGHVDVTTACRFCGTSKIKEAK